MFLPDISPRPSASSSLRAADQDTGGGCALLRLAIAAGLIAAVFGLLSKAARPEPASISIAATEPTTDLETSGD